jgi:protein tyrosine phosphatase (PTP) superfamily phosphohydrolase (DUF442 family)
MNGAVILPECFGRGMTRHRGWGQRLSLLSLLLLGGCAMTPRGLAPTHGIPNFARVNDGLYRGSQPDAASIQRLREIGVKTIVNLRSSSQPEEEREARRQGINYVAIPMRGLRGPSDEAVLDTLQVIEAAPRPVYVHCRYGCERTGTVIACYRIEYDHWNTEQALAEAKFYGMANWAVSMRRCVRRFDRSRLRPKRTSYRMNSNARPYEQRQIQNLFGFEESRNPTKNQLCQNT